MSARSATTGPGLPPLSTAITPVRATPVFTSRPSLRRWSATRPAVLVSCSPSSGCSWISRRQAISVSSIWAARWRISLSRSGTVDCAGAGATNSRRRALRERWSEEEGACFSPSPEVPGYPELETPTAAAGVGCRCDWVTPAGLTRPDELLLAGPGKDVERRVYGGSLLEPVAHLADDGLEGPQRGDHVGLGDRPHRSPAPHLAGHLALSTGDHDPMLLQQLRQHNLVVEALRRQNAGDGDRMHAVAREDLHPERLDGFMQCVGVACVTRPDVAGPFLLVKVDRDVERKGDRDRRRPGRLAFVEELLVLLQVEVEAGRLVRLHLLPCARAHRDHRESGRTRERLLRRGAHDIELPLVHLEFARAQAAHGVHDGVGWMIPDRARHRAQIDLHAGGRLVVGQQDACDLLVAVGAEPRGPGLGGD